MREEVLFLCGKCVTAYSQVHNSLTTYDAWLKGCEINNTRLYRLKDCDCMQETGLYKLTSEYMVRGHAYFRTPVYVVWWNGKQVLYSTNYVEAVRKWEALERSYK